MTPTSIDFIDSEAVISEGPKPAGFAIQTPTSFIYIYRRTLAQSGLDRFIFWLQPSSKITHLLNQCARCDGKTTQTFQNRCCLAIWHTQLVLQLSGNQQSPGTYQPMGYLVWMTTLYLALTVWTIAFVSAIADNYGVCRDNFFYILFTCMNIL